MNKITIKQLLSNTQQIDAKDAQLLLAHVLKKSREFVLAHPEIQVTTLQKKKFEKLVKKRANHIPLAYLTGHKEFYGLDFEVNTHTLVPRPETELMVELAKEQVIKNKEQVILIDVGTGSGCIPISILKALKHKNIDAFATDISKKALKTAKQNAEKHKVDITFLKGNLLTPFIKTCQPANLPTCQLIITANLPYLTEEQFQEEPSIQKEPKSALVADDHGLALYKELINQVKQNLLSANCSLFFEIDPSQAHNLSEYIDNNFPNAAVTVHKDFCNNDRIVSIVIPQQSDNLSLN